MKERPIIFCGQVIPPILRDTKTQTRRTRGLEKINRDLSEPFGPRIQYDGMNQNGDHLFFDCYGAAAGNEPPDCVEIVRCPYGVPGNRLWVRESWYDIGRWNPLDVPGTEVDWESARWTSKLPCPNYNPEYASDDPELRPLPLNWQRRKRPSIHMPRWASRIDLEITEVRVQRVQEISEVDAQSEGCLNDTKMVYGHMTGPIDYAGQYAYDRFAELWDSLNDKRGYSWESNPWVWAISFNRIRP